MLRYLLRVKNNSQKITRLASIYNYFYKNMENIQFRFYFRLFQKILHITEYKI